VKRFLRPRYSSTFAGREKELKIKSRKEGDGRFKTDRDLGVFRNESSEPLRVIASTGGQTIAGSTDTTGHDATRVVLSTRFVGSRTVCLSHFFQMFSA
jgi:hypothetical protein